MPIAIAMPRLGMKMEEGTVLEWRASPGDAVAKGQVVLLIESDKAETEIEAPADGVLRHVYVAPDTTVPCGAFLAVLSATAEEPLDPETFRTEGEPPLVPAAATPSTPAPAARKTPAGPPRRGGAITPAARKRARELGVDPSRVPGHGPGGRVTREDVETWAELEAARVEVAPGVFLEAQRQGSGDLVLLLPGFGSDASAFAPLLPGLSPAFELCTVNPRGVGASDAPAADLYDVATAAADAAALCADPAHVVGASLGAAVALELALRAPERVRTLALVTPFVQATPRLLAVLDAWCRIAAEASAEALAHFLLPWLFGPRTLSDERARRRALRGLAETAGRVPAETCERSLAGLRAWSGSRADALAKLELPVLVLAAAEDLLTPDARELAEALPNAQLVIVPEAGHALPVEAPGPAGDALLEHLSRARP